MVILLGAGVVGGTYFFDDVQLHRAQAEASHPATRQDGKTQMATHRRAEPHDRAVPEHQPDHRRSRGGRAEDKNFYDHNGIDMKGIVRAAWNNFTGGDTQGASTITQQYARNAADLKEISYNRKLREAVIARKLEDKYSKDEILGFYLNSVYFGRGAYGIEAAAQGVLRHNRSVADASRARRARSRPSRRRSSPRSSSSPSRPRRTRATTRRTTRPTPRTRWDYTLEQHGREGLAAAAERPTTYPKYAEFDPETCRTSAAATSRPA